jgi:hypothetical protein
MRSDIHGSLLWSGGRPAAAACESRLERGDLGRGRLRLAAGEIRHRYCVTAAKVIVQRPYGARRLACEDGFRDGKMLVDGFSNALDIAELHQAQRDADPEPQAGEQTVENLVTGAMDDRVVNPIADCLSLADAFA